MTPEEQRIAIAEACEIKTISGIPALDIPDYPNDLNAMREAVKTLVFSQLNRYRNALVGICSRGLGPSLLVAVGECIDATAAQRAEAFLRALNLWTD